MGLCQAPRKVFLNWKVTRRNLTLDSSSCRKRHMAAGFSLLRLKVLKLLQSCYSDGQNGDRVAPRIPEAGALFRGAVVGGRTSSRCSVINPSAATACTALSGCDIFQHQSRNELASMPMANRGCSRGGHTRAHLLMAFSIKLEPPRCKIATLIGNCLSMRREGQTDS